MLFLRVLLQKRLVEPSYYSDMFTNLEHGARWIRTEDSKEWCRLHAEALSLGSGTKQMYCYGH